MIVDRSSPITTLPEDYGEVYHLSILDSATLWQMQLLSIALFIPFMLLMDFWADAVQTIRGPYQVTQQLPDVVFWIGIIGVFILHELIHGIAIRWVGHTPRYGAKWAGPVPYVLFATADGAYFRPGEFIVIALAPVVMITLVGMVLMILLPDYMTWFIAVAVVLNGGGAIGDLWMTVVTLRHPPTSLIRDEEDSITIFAPQTPAAT